MMFSSGGMADPGAVYSVRTNALSPDYNFILSCQLLVCFFSLCTNSQKINSVP